MRKKGVIKYIETARMLDIAHKDRMPIVVSPSVELELNVIARQSIRNYGIFRKVNGQEILMYSFERVADVSEYQFRARISAIDVGFGLTKLVTHELHVMSAAITPFDFDPGKSWAGSVPVETVTYDFDKMRYACGMVVNQHTPKTFDYLIAQVKHNLVQFYEDVEEIKIRCMC